ncbi:MAG: hypothetical protein ACE5ER_00310 [Nitrospinaceae bacterium]
MSLAESPNLPNLIKLYVGQNGITDVGAVALIKSDRFPKLEILDLSLNRLGEATLKAVFKYNRDGARQIVTR